MQQYFCLELYSVNHCHLAWTVVKRGERAAMQFIVQIPSRPGSQTSKGSGLLFPAD
jgi:hypothetical protein